MFLSRILVESIMGSKITLWESQPLYGLVVVLGGGQHSVFCVHPIMKHVRLPKREHNSWCERAEFGGVPYLG